MNEVAIEARLLRMSVLDPEGSDCWVWIGKRTRTPAYGADTARRGVDYGRINIYLDSKHRTFAAHRIAWQIWRGPIPEGHEIDHACRNPYCINPAHLRPMTGKQNLARRVFGRR